VGQVNPAPFFLAMLYFTYPGKIFAAGVALVAWPAPLAPPDPGVSTDTTRWNLTRSPPIRPGCGFGAPLAGTVSSASTKAAASSCGSPCREPRYPLRLGLPVRSLRGREHGSAFQLSHARKHRKTRRQDPPPNGAASLGTRSDRGLVEARPESGCVGPAHAPGQAQAL